MEAVIGVQENGYQIQGNQGLLRMMIWGLGRGETQGGEVGESNKRH